MYKRESFIGNNCLIGENTDNQFTKNAVPLLIMYDMSAMEHIGRKLHINRSGFPLP